MIYPSCCCVWSGDVGVVQQIKVRERKPKHQHNPIECVRERESPWNFFSILLLFGGENSIISLCSFFMIFRWNQITYSSAKSSFLHFEVPSSHIYIYIYIYVDKSIKPYMRIRKHFPPSSSSLSSLPQSDPQLISRSPSLVVVVQPQYPHHHQLNNSNNNNNNNLHEEPKRRINLDNRLSSNPHHHHPLIHHHHTAATSQQTVIIGTENPALVVCARNTSNIAQQPAEHKVWVSVLINRLLSSSQYKTAPN